MQKAIDISKSEEMTEKHIKAIVGSERYETAPPEIEINRIVKNRSNYRLTVLLMRRKELSASFVD
jgi:hypothetical protein